MDNCGDKPPKCLSGLQPLMAIMDQFRTGSVCLAIKLMLLHMVDAIRFKEHIGLVPIGYL